MPAKDVTVTANYTVIQYTVSVAPNNPSYGTVTGSGTYNCGSTATLSAVPNTGYTFVGWYESGSRVSTTATYTFAVNGNRTLEARFNAIPYTITVNKDPTAGGSPTAAPNSAYVGQTVTLTASPDSCYNFSSWSSSDATLASTTASVTTFTMPAKNVSVTANYTIRQYTVSVAPNNPSYGTVTGSGTYNCGSTATLSAVPNTGYTFVGWYESGSVVSTNTTYTFTVNGPRTLEARFSANTYTITLKTNPTGAGSPSASPNPANVGQTVTLSANPGSCYNFSSWSVSAGTLNGNTLTMPAQNVTATANYTVKSYTISLSVNNSAYGTVSGGGSYNCGSSATVVATPATGYNFLGWYEGTTRVSTNATYTFTVNGNRTLQARFGVSASSYTITIVYEAEVPPSGNIATVSKNPASPGESVTLTIDLSAISSCYLYGGWRSPDLGQIDYNFFSTSYTFTMPAQNVTIYVNLPTNPNYICW